MVSPARFEGLHDSIIVGGYVSPGKVTLSGHKRAHKWDVKEADGNGGASTTYKGESVSQFTASFYLVDDPMTGNDEFETWGVFVRQLQLSLLTKPPTALDIYHPDLEELAISSVVVGGIGGLVHDGKGGATGTVEFIEYRPPKKKGGSPSGSKSPGSGTSLFDNTGQQKPDPNKDVKDVLSGTIDEASHV